MTQYEIVPLVLSNIEVEKSKMTYLANYGVKVLLPTVSFYLRGGEKNILVDTGASAQTMLRYEPNQAASDVISFEEALASAWWRISVNSLSPPRIAAPAPIEADVIESIMYSTPRVRRWSGTSLWNETSGASTRVESSR